MSFCSVDKPGPWYDYELKSSQSGIRRPKFQEQGFLFTELSIESSVALQV